MSNTKIHVPEAFYNLFTVGRMMGIPKATIAGFNKENPPSELYPIAHLFVSFVEDGRETIAIRKTYYDRWKRTGIPPKKNSGRPRIYDKGSKNIRIKAPEDYDTRFVPGVAKCNKSSIQKITIQDAIHIAMKEFMERRPSIFYGDDLNAK